VTLNSPGALATIGRLAARFGDQLAVGAGTVLTAEEVERVADAGGEFIVSPNRDQRVIGRTKQLGLASLPGCFTPSEIVEALDAGADAIKLFPVQPLGIDFVRAIQGPFPGLRLVPTGGVTPEMAQRYYAAGAWAVGVGSELMRGPLTSESDFDTLRVRVLGYLGGGVGRG
jgi:Entner-Doudoroff aldolase